MVEILTIEKIRKREKIIYGAGIIVGVVYGLFFGLTLLIGVIYDDFILIHITVNIILNVAFFIIIILMIGNYIDEIDLENENKYKQIMNFFYEKNNKK